MKFDVTIIGAGAAGLMCALEAGKRGRRVLVLERNETAGRKIRISGGGRCNFTNTGTGSDNFLSRNSSFHKSALSRYTPDDFIHLVRRHRIAFHEKKLGQLFCDGTAQQIIDMLLRECGAAGVELRTGCAISAIRKPSAFVIETNLGPFASGALVIATGGLSIPKLGASDFGYRIARQFGLNVIATFPGLVPLTFAGKERRLFREWAGVSVPARVSFANAAFRESVLFTHRGLSGPAILQISSYWRAAQPISLDLLDSLPREELVSPRTLKRFLPERIASRWTADYGDAASAENLSMTQREEFNRQLRNWILIPDGTEGYEKAEVTVGGVDTAELSSKTMESRRIPGLYFIGEVVDVTGHLGGFNFQWAWASGFAAGQYV